MSIVSRTRLIFQAKTNATLDSMEDPLEMLTYAEQQQRELLNKVGQGLIEVATSRHRLERRAQELKHRVPQLEEQAGRALDAGRDDLARVSLQRKQTALAELRDLEAQIVEVSAEERSMMTAHQQLTQRVEEFRHRRFTTTARFESAKARVVAGEMLTGVSSELAELSMAVGRAEERASRLQSRANAIDSLIATGTFSSPLGNVDLVEIELRGIDTKRKIDDELAAMRVRHSTQSPEPSAGADQI